MTNLDWLRAHINEPDKGECLIWPFSTSRGYAHVRHDGKTRKASRLMCEWVNGPPPSPAHEAAHSCDRGNHGCVHPRHLSWKTRSENQLERRRNGTQGRGREMNALRLRYRLTAKQVAEIRSIGNLETRTALAARYGVTRETIAKTIRGETWPANRKMRLPFTQAQVDEMRRLRDDGKTLQAIADATDAPISCVWRIVNGVSYRNVSS
jgi:hypothetical protein